MRYNKLKITKKNIVMSFIPCTEQKQEKKKLEIRSGIRIRYPGSGSVDPDPH